MTIDLNFSGDDSSWMSFPPLELALPCLIDSFGNFVTLQDENAPPLLPNLVHLSERTTTPCETYTVYYAQTGFRFSFYGSFSPRIFSVPQFPGDAARWIHEPAQRFPATLLQKTETLILKDFIDVDELFPVLQVEPPLIHPNLVMEHLGPPGAQLSTSPVSKTVQKIYLIGESFAQTFQPEGLHPYLLSSIERTSDSSRF